MIHNFEQALIILEQSANGLFKNAHEEWVKNLMNEL